MIDLALDWNVENWSADLVLTGGALATHDGLRTAILISLFTDARAPDGAVLPEDGADRGGWWGDAFSGETSATIPDADARNAIGSLLHLLRRAKVTPQALRDARAYAFTASSWMLRDGIASAVNVTVEAQGSRLAIGIDLDRPNGPDRERYDFTWEASS